jgi:hypothetical protein
LGKCKEGASAIPLRDVLQLTSILAEQNLNGNTALYYLVEYKHSQLAEYVKSKGAIDTIQNAARLTCYEGLSMEQAEAL